MLISPSFHIIVADTSAAIAENGTSIESRRVFFSAEDDIARRGSRSVGFVS